MKGVFFSADFVLDKNDILRLIEVNTDTGILISQKYVFDWTDFITVLSKNGIVELEVIYKFYPQQAIVDSLESAITTGATFITSFIKTIVPEDEIFPPTMPNSDSKFILRMAYDELAIMDSEYAKGTLELLKLFADAGDSESVIGFYHSSPTHGYYNTIDTSLPNPSNIPDIISKTIIELQQPHNFYKIGFSGLTSEERLNLYISGSTNPDILVEEYHFLPSSTEEYNKVVSQRTFQIAYGDNLDLCYVADYEIPSVFELPESIEYDDSQISNMISRKHYYEFATNHIKNYRHGFNGDINIQFSTGGTETIANVIMGEQFNSYYIEGTPDTDDDEILRNWKTSGYTFPDGSYATSSVVVSKYTGITYANDMTTITFENGVSLIVGGETRLLVYDVINDCIRFVRVLDLTTDFMILSESSGKLKIIDIDTTIFEESQIVYALNLEDVDNFLIEVDGIYGFSMAMFYIVHNACFPAGTKIKMGDGTEKNIESIVVGDNVLSLNETTHQTEPKVVTELIQPVHKDFVEYRFIDGKTLKCTFDHPIYVDNMELASFRPEWTKERYNIDKDIRQIKEGDSVYLPDRSTKIIHEILPIPSPDGTQTYLIRVEDNHNFFANNILVHNK